MNYLLLGGARSGKSSYAERLAKELGGRVLFVATAEAGDEEMRRRIEKHKKGRPAGWKTLEASLDVAACLPGPAVQADVVILDCITLLMNNILCRQMAGGEAELDAERVEKEANLEIDALIECMKKSQASFIIVSNEVGCGLVPADAMSRLYRDMLGRANQTLAAFADYVYLMVAGIPLPLKPQAGA